MKSDKAMREMITKLSRNNSSKERIAIAYRRTVHRQRKSYHRTATAYIKIYLCKRISHALSHNSIKRGAESGARAALAGAAANVL